MKTTRIAGLAAAGVLAVTAVAPAVALNSVGPKSGFHAGSSSWTT